MKKNMGNADRFGRTLIAVVVAYLFFSGLISGALGIIFIILGGVLLLTSFIGICPLYTLVGFSSCPVKRA